MFALRSCLTTENSLLKPEMITTNYSNQPRSLKIPQYNFCLNDFAWKYKKKEQQQCIEKCKVGIIKKIKLFILLNVFFYFDIE